MPKETLPTQEIIEVADIQNDALVLRDGGLRKILLVSGVNFELKSEEEQNLILLTYQELLHAINFPLQILIHTRHLNIAGYLATIADRQQRETNQLLKQLIGDYHDFINGFVNSNPIMTKSFFVVVPYQPGISLEKVGRGVLGILGRRAAATAGSGEPKADDFRQLEQQVGQVISGLGLIGLRAVPLNKDELLELLSKVYNVQ